MERFKTHGVIGLALGFIMAFYIVNYYGSWSRLQLGVLVSTHFFYWTVLFEFIQHLVSDKKRSEYFTRRKVKDTLLGILVGNLAFNFPLWFIGVLNVLI